jgi:hypothetical protein
MTKSDETASLQAAVRFISVCSLAVGACLACLVPVTVAVRLDDGGPVEAGPEAGAEAGPDAGPGCTIDGSQVPNGQVDPRNGCLSCQPEVSASDWTRLPDWTPCDCSRLGPGCGDGGICAQGACIQPECTIGGATYARRATDPNNAAYCCNPVASQRGWTSWFTHTGTYDTGAGPGGMMAADLNGDGLVDLAIVTAGGLRSCFRAPTGGSSGNCPTF